MVTKKEIIGETVLSKFLIRTAKQGIYILKNFTVYPDMPVLPITALSNTLQRKYGNGNFFHHLKISLG